MNFIETYIESLARQFRSGIAREHAYRSELKILIETVVKLQGYEMLAVNEPARDESGAPDFVITQNNVPIGTVETKNLTADLNSKEYQEQFNRYKKYKKNLLITNYLDFQFYENGELSAEFSVAELKNGKIIPLLDNHAICISQLKHFLAFDGTTITSANQMVKLLADETRLLQQRIEKSLSEPPVQQDTTLADHYQSFQDLLIPGISVHNFSDVYAQTVTYGLFASRLHCSIGRDFSRITAVHYVPNSNPFLQQFFENISGTQLDKRIIYIVDFIVKILRHSDIDSIMEEFGTGEHQHDPVIHFYESFLEFYDKQLKKERGVWYTPASAVEFIVNAVDSILVNEFNLKDGLADYGKVKMENETVHHVQILDPATGTGTFLAEVIRCIHSKFAGKQGAWQSYVSEHLIPRLHGFEILMAPYSIAHLKIDRCLQDTGYTIETEKDRKKENPQRLSIYLTNSLEQGLDKEVQLKHVRWLSDEANGANKIKRKYPVMVVLGNPPYNVSSCNKNTWIDGLVEEYKEGVRNEEKNIQPMSDDYIKFIRLGQKLVEKNVSGILAYVSSNGFLDGLIHRQMRKQLAEMFDTVYILNLHGNSRRKETSPDNSKDENIFNIMQGVCINIYVKRPACRNTVSADTGGTGKLADVYYADLYGRRSEKYVFLRSRNLQEMEWKRLKLQKPYYFFVPKDFTGKRKYDAGFSIAELFPVQTSGIKTHNDNELVGFTEFTDKDTGKILITNQEYHYRPFDFRFINYDRTKVIRHRYKVMRHLTDNNNIALIFARFFGNESPPVFLTNFLCDIRTWSCPGAIGTDYAAPLYLYPEDDLHSGTERVPNLNADIIEEIAECTGLTFTAEPSKKKNTFSPYEIFDYIYAVLHSPRYREKYKEFLKIDFPRVPYPLSAKEFTSLIAVGTKLRKLHLFEDNSLSNVSYPSAGTHKIESVKYADAKVYINETQHFGNVSESAWNFYIGGYQPAQKYLKDRKGRTLTFAEIEHYGKIIAVLIETEKLMNEVDAVLCNGVH